MQTYKTKYPDLTDEILFNRYIGGDLKAFEELLSRHKGLIFSLILRYVRGHAEAEELFQEVFFKVCKNKDQFREAISFKSWLATVCKNTCIDHLRRKNRRLKTETFDGITGEDKRPLADRVASEDVGPDDEVTIQMETASLEGLLQKLPLEQRETFYMKVVMELTFEEIGQSMDCSPNTAKSRYRYALTMLQGLVRRKRVLEKAV